MIDTQAPGIGSPSGQVFWLFGLSGAGKSTLAAALREALRSELGLKVLSLDGDTLRAGLSIDLGFSEADRAENLRRAAHVARMAADDGFVVVAAFITPLEANRNLVESIIGRERLSLVFLGASVAVCRARDVKGLYARAAAGDLKLMSGMSAAFEPPGRCSLSLPTGTEGVAVSAAALVEFARARLAAAMPALD